MSNPEGKEVMMYRVVKGIRHLYCREERLRHGEGVALYIQERVRVKRRGWRIRMNYEQTD